MWFIGSSGIYCMPNFLIFPLHTPELYEVWWDYSAVGVWPWFWPWHHCKARSAPALGQSVWYEPLAEPHCHGAVKGRGTAWAPQSGVGDEELTQWPLEVYEALGPPCVPSRRCLLPSQVHALPVVFGRTKCGILTVNRAGLCPFPASPDHVNKRLVPNCGIKWDGVFHHQRALELHLRLLFVSVETTWTTGRARSWKRASTCIYLKPWACPQKLAQMKYCDGKGWDLQLQRPAVPCSCPGCVHGAPVSTEQAGLAGMVSLSTAQASVLEKQDRLWWGLSWPEMPGFHCHQHHSELRCADPSLQPAQACSGVVSSMAPGEAQALGTALPGTVSNLRLGNLLLQNQKIPK